MTDSVVKRRRSRYPVGVVAFAIAARSRGVKWDDISNDIAEQFKIKAPSPRRMRDWKQALDENDPATSSRRGDHSAEIGALADAYSSIGLKGGRLNEVLLNGLLLRQLQTIMDTAKAGKDPVIAAGAEIMLAIYKMSGDKVFEQILAEFRERQFLDIEETKKMKPNRRQRLDTVKKTEVVG